MNDIYFYCQKCKEYVDAGYRWGYWGLEAPGLVIKGELFDVESVLAKSDYWQADFTGHGEWLREVLPRAKDFLLSHREHGLRYGEAENFLRFGDTDFDWLDCSDHMPDESPRYYAERLKLTSWSEVEEHVARKMPYSPYWWDYEDMRARAKIKLQSLKNEPTPNSAFCTEQNEH